MDDKRSRILQIARYLETGDYYSRDQIAETLHVSRNLVSTILKVMSENRWNYDDLESIDSEVIHKLFRRRDFFWNGLLLKRSSSFNAA